jgi:hypothetical protein
MRRSTLYAQYEKGEWGARNNEAPLYSAGAFMNFNFFGNSKS